MALGEAVNDNDLNLASLAQAAADAQDALEAATTAYTAAEALYSTSLADYESALAAIEPEPVDLSPLLERLDALEETQAELAEGLVAETARADHAEQGWYNTCHAAGHTHDGLAECADVPYPTRDLHSEIMQ